MATVTKIGEKTFRVQVRLAGYRSQSDTFIAKDTSEKELEKASDEASAWGRSTEKSLRDGKKVGINGKTGVSLGDTIDRFISEAKKIGKTKLYILGRIKRDMGRIVISKMTDDDIIEYIQDQDFGPMSGAMHFSFLSGILKMAKIGWKYHVPEIISEARERLKFLGLIGKSEERTRRPTEQEISLLLNYKFPTPIPMAEIISFAMSSAMRQAEIMRITHSDTNKIEKTTVIRNRKHPKKTEGNHQTVPLLDESIEIICRQPKKESDDRIFPYLASTIGTYFTLACQKLDIEDLHFHDLRHEGTSRLFEMGYQIHEVAMFTGHLDWKQLKRYTQLKAKEIRRPKQIVVSSEVVDDGSIVIDKEMAKQFKQFLAMKKMMEAEEA